MMPMMSEKEIEIIDNLIEEKKPKNVLEWGAGGSTVYFPKKHPSIEKWVAIEHSEKWFQDVSRHIGQNASIRLVRLENYLQAAKDAMSKYDLILIDGLMRAECLMFAEDLLNDGGTILIHDSGRPEYQDWIKKSPLKNEKLIDGEIPVHWEGFAHRGIHKFYK